MNTMTYKGCQGKFEYYQDADVFHGEVLHLNDMVTFQGRSIDELKKPWLILWDIICCCAGKSARLFSGKFNICVPQELHQQIAGKAADAGVSLNTWVNFQLQDCFK